MNTEDVKIFFEISKSRNISAAANNLFLAQSTVSRRLAMLEKELGAPLFVRGKGFETISLTPFGERFSLIAQQITLLDEEAHALSSYGGIRHLSISSTDSIASYPLKAFFYQLSRSQPKWDIEIEIHDSIEIYEMVSNRMIDVGITNGAAPLSELSSTLLFEEDFVVMRRGKCASQSQWVHPEELKPNHEIFQLFSEEYHRWHNFWWRPGVAKIRVNHALFTVGFLTDPEDWAILPLSVALALLPEDGYLSRLSESPPKRRCFMILHKKLRPDRSATIREFQTQLTDFCRSQVPTGF